MRALFLIVILAAATRAAAYDHFISPDSRFEVYTTTCWPDGTGMKLFLRRAHTHDTGILLWKNDRWIDAKWSPDSRFLAVVDHPDGHVSDIYVFGVSTNDAATPPALSLFYHTPDPFTYDVQWEILSWDPKARQIVFKKDVRDQNAHTFTTQTVTEKIGTKALPFKNPNGT